MKKNATFNPIFKNFVSTNFVRYGIFLLLFFHTPLLFSKGFGKKVASIPFDMVGSYVVVKVKVNESTSLNLILDSGIRNTIITELQPSDKISLNFSDVKDVMGLGGGNNLEAFKSNFNELRIGKLKMESKTVYVLREDVFNLSKHTGTPINGLIGMDFFYDYMVEINNTDKRINFYKNSSFTPTADYESLPLIFVGQKIFIDVNVIESDNNIKKARMLLDTGAELNAWFQTHKSNAVKLPASNVRCTIGEGFNGEIKGLIGKLPQICLGKHCLVNPIVAFPDSICIAEVVKDSDRDGTIGAQLLTRFNYMIDLTNRMFYFKPNSSFSKKYSYNIAGIEVTQILPNVHQTEVWKIWENSPAAIAGVQVGDQIIELNNQKAFQLNVNDLKSYFETPSKTPLSLIVNRNGKEISFKINMTSKI